jgi:hypothetical protein
MAECCPAAPMGAREQVRPFVSKSGMVQGVGANCPAGHCFQKANPSGPGFEGRVSQNARGSRGKYLN